MFTSIPVSLTGLTATGFDAIQLTDAAAYTLTGAQALKSRIGSAGTLATLTSTGVITVLANNADNLSSLMDVDVIQLALDAAVTMTIAQNGLINAAAGNNTVTLADVGPATGNSSVKTYVLANGDQTFTLGAAGQNVLTGTGDAIISASGTLSGTLNGTNGGNVILKLTASSDISNATLTAVDEIQIIRGGSITLTAAQAALTQVRNSSDNGYDAVGVFTGASTVTVKVTTGATDLTTLVGVDIVEIASGATATMTADQVDGITVIGECTLVVTGADANSASVLTNIHADVVDITAATLGTVTWMTVAAGDELRLTAAQANGMAIAGADSNAVITVTGLAAGTNLTSVGTTATVNATVTTSINITANSNLGSVDSYAISTGQTLTATAVQLTDKTVTGAGGVVLTDTTVMAALLNTLDFNVAGLVDASAATQINGTAANIKAAIDADDAALLLKTDFSSSITASSAAIASELIAIAAANGAGVINAASAATITGSAANLAMVTNNSDILLNGTVALVANTPTTILEATAIFQEVNTGGKTYSITDEFGLFTNADLAVVGGQLR